MLASLLGLLPLLVVLSSPVAAQNDANNLAVLNTALALTNMNSAFFNCFLTPNNLNYASLCNSISPAPSAFNAVQFATAGYPQNVFDAMVALGSQEASTASLLTSSINSASAGSAYPACRNYTFSNTTTVVTYLQNGLRLMANTLGFFNGGLNGLANTDLQTVMARVGSVKGRHTAFLNNLVNSSFVAGTSNGFDLEIAPAVANASTAPYQLDCSNIMWVAPTIRPYGVSRSSTNGTSWTGPLAQSADAYYGSAARQNDINAMNYFLAVENLAFSFFSNITATFNDAAFTNAGFTSAIRPAVQRMASDDAGHVSAYASLIPAYGGVVMPNCSYNFTAVTQSVNGSLAFASTLVNLGVQAYNGRLNAITDTLFQQAAATVATVHSRHSAILNLIQAGWNGAFIAGNQTAHAPLFIDNAMNPSDVLTAVQNSGVLLSCPMTIPQPSAAPGAVFGSSSTGMASSSSTGFFSSSTGNGASHIGLSAGLLVAVLPVLFL